MGEKIETRAQAGGRTRQRPLRLWPGVVLVTLQWLARFVVPTFAPEFAFVGVMGGLAGGLAVVLWWAFLSRVRPLERWGGLVLMGVALVVTSQLLHESIETGMQGWMFAVYVTPPLSLALVVWALVTRNMAAGWRRATLVAAVLIPCGLWTLVRTGGFTGNIDHDFAWRWSATPEERLLTQAVEQPRPRPSVPQVDPSQAEWPGFRGPGRDSVVRGVRIDPNWSEAPPVELWRRAIGPGWSSFAVAGDRLYTQEQRGDDEVVSCYLGTTGELVWRHHDRVRFWESNAGPGPRGTPTLSGGRVYTLGATGVLNALDASDGSVVWSRNAAIDTGAELPDWGFSGSPLVVDDLLVVAAAGALAAYDLAAGDLRWTGPTEGGGYSSPQLLTIDGVEQVVLLSEVGATGVEPSDGNRLWEHAFPGVPIVQPALTEDGDVLVTAGDRSGLRRLQVAQETGRWTVVERWTSTRLKPYYNDYVVHAGHAYGLDLGILTCVDLETGKRQWKGGRYGYGQLVLLVDSDLLLVLSEEGELALVEANADEHTELARFQAIEGKTWNHPVLVGDVLMVRNAQEMAAFRLSLVDG